MVLSTVAPPGAAREGTPSEDRRSEESYPFVVGFDRVPRDLEEGDEYENATVVDVNRRVDYIEVRAGDADAFRRSARLDPHTIYVQEDPKRKLIRSGGESSQGDADRSSGGPSIQLTPNDPKYANQYGPQQIRADDAWDTTLGDSDAAVCIVDTGTRYTHEDLSAHWVDGFDFVNSDSDPWDDHGHGTHVSGIAAAVIDNGDGIAGIGNVDIYATKVLNSAGFGSWSDVADGITWCADHTPTTTVISMSLGGATPSLAVKSALSYAFNQKGKLVTAAAGNSGPCFNCVHYPAKYLEAMAVTCTDSSEDQCWFSSQGPEAELAAPGYGILSTYNGGDSDYATLSGTSMSTPHVSGAAALAWSCSPGTTNVELRSTMDLTAQDLGIPGLDPVYGHGEVDAKNLVDAVCGSGTL